ncbi:kinase-like domain-containing protein [Gigaspora rosea]|uniref:Kinase-like domain-containing protein n=1 Tax=Gigaspora rosea TaxID=44941 RepID=A0A397UY26_9GLOM|nr:kinase-like domain-containing protein [Gigaspora rosea]
MAYARGGSLHKNLNLVAQLEWNDKLKLLHSIVSDLQIIHSHELIHRDLHSGNILLDDICNAYIADLGLSLSVKEDSNGIYGILAYVDPEVLNGKPYTTASDIYSFGIIMWEILYGRPVSYDLEDQSMLQIEICFNNLRPTIIGNVPQHYINLMKGCWEKESKKRPTADKICEIFTEWQSNEKILLELSVSKVTIENFKYTHEIKSLETYTRSKYISKSKSYSQEMDNTDNELVIEIGSGWTPPGSSQINK